MFPQVVFGVNRQEQVNEAERLSSGEGRGLPLSQLCLWQTVPFAVQSPSIASSIDSPERRLMRWPELSIRQGEATQILIKELN